MYLRYLIYVLKHKWHVFKICCMKGMFIHAFTHDLSKFLPSEFIPYAKYFYGGKKNETEFRLAVLEHYHRNKHHTAHWVGSDGKVFDMPEKYVKQLIADWWAMSYAKKKKEYGSIGIRSNEVLDDLMKFYQNMDHSQMSAITCFYIEDHLRRLK